MNMASRKLLNGDDVFVIADIGKNFIKTEEDRSVSEYLQNAMELVDAAADSGVDAVKFQTHEVEDEQAEIEIISPHFHGSDRHSWVSRNTNATPIEEFWKLLKQHCDKRGVIFFSTPMSRKAAKKLDSVGVPFWKVGSGDVLDYSMLEFMTATKKPIIISTGMVSLAELDEVVNYITLKNSPLVILYCISKYPAPAEYFNLATIEYLKERWPDVTVGFSDHSIGYDISLSAVKLGARIVEKHFSFSRESWGPDHKVSMTPKEMKEMISAIKGSDYENYDESIYYGVKEKELEGANNEFRQYFHKTLVAGRDISAGQVIDGDDIYAMRPRAFLDGMPSWKFGEVAWYRVKRSLKKYEPLKEEDLY